MTCQLRGNGGCRLASRSLCFIGYWWLGSNLPGGIQRTTLRPSGYRSINSWRSKMSQKRRRWRFFRTRWKTLTKADGPAIHLGALSLCSSATQERCGRFVWGTYCGWLFIKYLWVRADHGRGIGRELIARAEARALERDCHSAWLDTFSFQARGSTRSWVMRSLARLITHQLISGIS